MRALGASRTSLVPGGALAGGWARDPLWKTARAVPSLDLRFADNKTLGDAYGGGSPVTFTRASTGRFVGSDGLIQTAAVDAPRFDHNPTTGESLGLLVEEARTNLVLNSATFQPSSGGAPASYTVDQVAPDGTTTGSRQTAANPRTLLDYTGIANALYTFSFYCRVTSGTAVFSIQVKNASSDTTITNDTTPVATTSWRRFTISGTTSGATAGVRIELNGVVPGFVLWGAMLEAGAFPTSYIPTTAATVTRAADVASITGANFSSWYNQTEGTVFANATAAVAASILPCYASIDNGTTSERLQLRRVTSGTSPSYRVVAGGQSIDSATKTIGSPTGFNSQVLAYASSNYEGACNGTLEGLTSIANRPTVTQLQIGNGIGSAAVNGTIKRLVYWGQRLPNNVLQAITQP